MGCCVDSANQVFPAQPGPPPGDVSSGNLMFHSHAQKQASPAPSNRRTMYEHQENPRTEEVHGHIHNSNSDNWPTLEHSKNRQLSEEEHELAKGISNKEGDGKKRMHTSMANPHKDGGVDGGQHRVNRTTFRITKKE